MPPKKKPTEPLASSAPAMPAAAPMAAPAQFPQGYPQMMPGQQPMMGMPGQMMPGQQPMMMPGQMMPGQMMPGQMTPGQMQGQLPGFNPMAQFMQMMQGMMYPGMGLPQQAPVDASAQPFQSGAREEEEKGLQADIVRPATVGDLVKDQKAIAVQPVLDLLCLSSDGKHALGGLPVGCTIAFAGPPGKGKTRAMLEGIARVAAAGTPCAYVVAEEGFRDDQNPGRDDLCSRFAKIAMAATGLDEAGLKAKVLPNVLIILSQYHKGHTWDDFIRRYRHVVEDQGVRFVVVDSLNTLDPTHARTADNLAVLKTYNHEHGVTCVTIGQIKDTGEPVGGEALVHTADAVFLIEEMSLGSKEQAEFWGGKYREKITVIQARKSVTTPICPHPIRVGLDASGRLAIHEGHPAALPVPTLAGK